MTVSMSVLSKKSINIIEFVQDYFQFLETLYTVSELEGFLYSKSGSVLGLCFEGDLGPVSDEFFSIERVTIADRSLNVMKICHSNTHVSRISVVEVLRKYSKINSSFLVLNHNIRYKLDKPLTLRYPRLLNEKIVYSSTGHMTTYFERGLDHDKLYMTDTRGIVFADSYPNDDIVEIIDRYYSNFLESADLTAFIDPNTCGLKHFTTLLSSENSKLKVSFLHNKMIDFNVARYFFEPDVFVSSNDAILRLFRNKYYPDLQIDIKNNLKVFSAFI